jgi:Acyl-CoA dehydrogenase, C-terminal domain
MQQATPHTVAYAAKAVDLVHTAAGTSAICNENKFQQYLRDVHTITQHAFGVASRDESVGAVMLGMDQTGAFLPFKYTVRPLSRCNFLYAC